MRAAEVERAASDARERNSRETRAQKQNPAEPQLYGVPPPFLAETEGFEPSIQVLAQMLP
jgi:hypothetical protein